MEEQKLEQMKAWIEERFVLSLNRVHDINRDNQVKAPFKDYFDQMAAWMLFVAHVYELREKGVYAKLSLDEKEKYNYRLYEDILQENGRYQVSYANPAYACMQLGRRYGQLLSWLTTEIRGLIILVFEGRLADMTAIFELFIEIYNCFESEVPSEKTLEKIIYWYVSDYTDQTVARRIREKFDPSLDFYKKIIMESDLSDMSYLYDYGAYISDNERKIAQFLNEQSEDIILSMADTFVSGYIRGFEVYKIDLSVKKYVQIRANMGFERVLRAVIRMFEAKGLDVIICGEAAHSVNKTAVRFGYISCSANPQYDYDHRQDKGLYMDKAFCERYASVTRQTYEKYKELIALYAGPAVMEVFGEKAFEPEVKEANIQLTPKQQKISVRLTGQTSEILNQYLDASTTSFSIIAWPLPSIGEDFEAIFSETICVNNLDNDIYRKIQQTMIDAMDGAAYVHIKGMNGNRTDLKVALWQLKDPAKETVFENCCADVNIPVGEIFTSPVLTGTEGILHVSSVYLNGLNYRQLALTFKDGCIENYTCMNYDDLKDNEDYLKQNLLQNRETLPMGEFAIGTNTVAYTMARKYHISDRMPILIMEKTGPHFAIGDTCYSHSEEHRVYNQDGKEIVARENEISALRHTDMEQAYFNVHTDITIPYNEIESITACFADGHQIEIIQKGRFCLAGTELLNQALD